MKKQNLSKIISFLLAVLILITAVFSSACSSGNESTVDSPTESQTEEATLVFPSKSEISSIKIGIMSSLLEQDKYKDDYKDIKYGSILEDSALQYIRYEIDSNAENSEILFDKAIETDEKINELENYQLNKFPFGYKCEYTLKDGSKIEHSYKKLSTMRMKQSF